MSKKPKSSTARTRRILESVLFEHTQTDLADLLVSFLPWGPDEDPANTFPDLHDPTVLRFFRDRIVDNLISEMDAPGLKTVHQLCEAIVWGTHATEFVLYGATKEAAWATGKFIREQDELALQKLQAQVTQ
jgi:hypothetical protein